MSQWAPRQVWRIQEYHCRIGLHARRGEAWSPLPRASHLCPRRALRGAAKGTGAASGHPHSWTASTAERVVRHACWGSPKRLHCTHRELARCARRMRLRRHVGAVGGIGGARMPMAADGASPARRRAELAGGASCGALFRNSTSNPAALVHWLYAPSSDTSVHGLVHDRCARSMHSCPGGQRSEVYGRWPLASARWRKMGIRHHFTLPVRGRTCRP